MISKTLTLLNIAGIYCFFHTLFLCSLQLTSQFKTSDFTSANKEMMQLIQLSTPFHSRMQLIIKYFVIYILFYRYHKITDYVEPRCL